jgi:hypothetical protein
LRGATLPQFKKHCSMSSPVLVSSHSLRWLHDFLDFSMQFFDRNFAKVGGAGECSEFRDQFAREFVGMTFNHSN